MSGSRVASCSCFKVLALSSTALSLMLLAGTTVAMAQATVHPTSNSLPGRFYTNQANTTYAVSGDNNGTITISGAARNSVLEWGTSGFGTEVAPNGTVTAPNNGFSIGAGASLTLKGGLGATLVDDASGGASAIFGTLTATGLPGPLYIANPSGIVVGAGGTVAAPRQGVGLLGFDQTSIDPAFATSGTIDSRTGSGTGEVTVSPAASISGGPLLIAGNSTVNVGAVAPSTSGDTYVLDGATFTTAAGSVMPTTTALISSGSAAVNFTGGTSRAALVVSKLAAGGAVNNSGAVDLSNITWGAARSDGSQILGTFTNAANATAAVKALVAGSIVNAGTLTESGGMVTAVGQPDASSGADITNSGVIDETTTSLGVLAGASGGVTGNFANIGIINFVNAAAPAAGYGTFIVNAANIFLGGAIQQGGTALDTANFLDAFALDGGYAVDPFSASPGPTPSGVVDIASSVYTGTVIPIPAELGGRFGVTSGASQIVSQAIRVLSGGVTAVGVPSPAGIYPLAIYPGTGTPTDPFVHNGKLPDGTASNVALNDNLSLFPGTALASATGTAGSSEQSGPSIWINGFKSSATSPGTNINLNGVVSTAASGANDFSGGNIRVIANTINGNGGADGDAGFALESGGVLTLNVSGNVNDPAGAAANYSTAFQYNYILVSVAPTTDSLGNPIPGTATILIPSGPRALGSVTPKGTVAQFINLLVSGNVSFESSLVDLTTAIAPQPTYADNHLVLQATGNISAAGYWPGLLYLATVTRLGDPTSFSANNNISLNGDLSNALPANLKTKDVMGSTGHGGVFLMTNHLNLDGNTVTISNDSWVNFSNTQTMAALQPTNGKSLFASYLPTTASVGVQQLPASDFKVASTSPSAAVTLNFVNQNTSYLPADVYTMFGGTTTLQGTIIGGTSLQLGKSYTLAQLQNGVDLSNFPGGKIYVSLGAPLTSGNAGNNYAPNMSNSTLPDYTTQWGNIELTYISSTDPGKNAANLTAADQFGVPLKLATTNTTSPVQLLTWTANTASVMQNLAALSGNAVADPNGPSGTGITTTNAIIVNPGGSGVTIPGVSAPVVRIISPSTVPPGSGGSTPYPSMQPYLASIQQTDEAGKYTTIEGSHIPSSGVDDTYNFKAYVESNQPPPQGVSAGSIHPGDLVLVGSITGTGAAPGGTPTVAVVPKGNLTNFDIYGAANGLFTMLQGTDLNGSVTHAVADYLSALNFGLIDSPEQPSGYSGPLGDLPSYEWYGNTPSGLINKLPIQDAFAAAQPSCSTCYNSYAAYLATVTNAYGFAFNDRLQTPILTFMGGDTLTLTVLP